MNYKGNGVLEEMGKPRGKELKMPIMRLVAQRWSGYQNWTWLEYPYREYNSLATASDFDAYPGCSRGLAAGIHGQANLPDVNNTEK